MCRPQNTAMRDYQESVTTRQTGQKVGGSNPAGDIFSFSSLPVPYSSTKPIRMKSNVVFI